jgi:L-lysine exporter family protein LysE/ArgO
MLSAASLTSVSAGLGFGLSLIVAIGPQNAYVLRQGALREHVPTVVAICSASDVLLIVVGIAGAGAVLTAQPSLLDVIRVAGAAVLVVYGALAARRALTPPGHDDEPATTPPLPLPLPRASVIAACLAFTWLNPAVYLDTVVLLGSVANARPGHQWWFGAGAAVASVLWFAAIGFGARLLRPVLRRPRAWRVVDAGVAIVMAVTALRVLRLA